MQSIEGQAAPAGCSIWWTYGWWFAEQEAESGKDGFQIESGCTYRLRGYETGSWRGIVNIRDGERMTDASSAASAIVPGGRGFWFRNEFRVVDGELLQRGTLSDPDPLDLTRSKKGG